MTIDWTKPVQTLDGRPVTIITREGREPYSVVGYIGDQPIPVAWRTNGINSVPGSDCGRVLCNAPERVERWANVYGGDYVVGGTHETRQDADREAGRDRTTLVKYTFEDDRLISAEVVEVDQ